MRKTSDKSQLREKSQLRKIPGQYSKLSRSSKKGNLRSPHSQKEPKDTWLLSEIWHPECDPAPEKGHLVKLGKSE